MEKSIEAGKMEPDRAFSNEEMQYADKTLTRESILSMGPAPDGGWLAWAQVAAGFFCTFNSPGLVNSFGVYQQFYTTNGVILASATESQVAWIGTILAVLSLVGASFFSFLIDRGYGHIMAICASIVSSFSFMMLSLSTEYYQIILTQGVLAGISSSVLFCCALSGVAPYFSSKRGVALGITAVGSSMGGIVYSVATQRLLYTVGFPWTCRITGFIILVTGVGTGMLFRPRVLPQKRYSFFATDCFKQADWMVYCTGILFAYIGLYIFYDFYQSYAYSYDHQDQTYVYLTAILNVGSLVGRLVPSYLIDKIGIFNVLIPATIISGILSFCWIPATQKAGIITIGVLFGCFSGCITVAPGVVAVQLTPKERMNQLGIIISFSFIFLGLGFICGPPFAGMIIHKYGYLGAQLYASISWVIASILFITSRQLQLKGRPFWSKC